MDDASEAVIEIDEIPEVFLTEPNSDLGAGSLVLPALNFPELSNALPRLLHLRLRHE
jgi:hypothetical protein